MTWDNATDWIQAVAAVLATLFALLAIRDQRHLERERRDQSRPYFMIKYSVVDHREAIIHYVNVGSNLAVKLTGKVCWVNADGYRLIHAGETTYVHDTPTGATNTLTSGRPSNDASFFFVVALKYRDSLSDRTFSQVFYLAAGRYLPAAGRVGAHVAMGWANENETRELERALRQELADYL